MHLKQRIVRHYPDLTEMIYMIEDEVGPSSSYKDLSRLLNRKLLKEDFESLPLIKKIIVSFVCPDTEFKSRLSQFVYEELSTIFDFTEDLTKLHNFIKTASWHMPIALFTTNGINIVNTVCSIASYYGVGLEVL